ncbi:hypothetical protein ACF0H5_012329 [Mactra antiquata]
MTQPVVNYNKWSLFQKNKLLRLLKEYPLDAYESIACHFPTKDAEQVEVYIRKLKEEVKKKKVVKREELHRIPLEEWLFVAKDLVDYENVDCSANLQKVMSVISKFEDFSKVKIEGYNGPDYSSIYKFLAQIFGSSKKEDVVQLGPLESAIMLDMIHSLMEVLTQHDTSVQRNVMKWKYRLMNYRYQRKIVPEMLRKASENDFEELIKEMHENKHMEENRKTFVTARIAETLSEKKKSIDTPIYRRPKQSSQSSSSSTRVAKVSSQNQINEMVPETDKSTQNALTTTGHQSVPDNYLKPSTSTQQTPQPSTSSCRAAMKPSSSSSSASSMASSSAKQSSSSPVIDLTNTSNLIDKIPVKKSSEFTRHKPGRKSALDQPEIPRTEVYLVMPPKGVKIVNYVSRGKKTIKPRLDGKYQAPPNKEIVLDDINRNVTYDLHESVPEKAVCVTSVIKSEAASRERKRLLELEADEKYNELMSLHDDDSRKKPIKKPKLYSINPFCLPVSLIDLNSSKIE